MDAKAIGESWNGFMEGYGLDRMTECVVESPPPVDTVAAGLGICHKEGRMTTPSLGYSDSRRVPGWSNANQRSRVATARLQLGLCRL